MRTFADKYLQCFNNSFLWQTITILFFTLLCTKSSFSEGPAKVIEEGGTKVIDETSPRDRALDSITGALVNRLAGFKPKYIQWTNLDGTSGSRLPRNYNKSNETIPTAMPDALLSNALNSLTHTELQKVQFNLFNKAFLLSEISTYKFHEILNGNYTHGQVADPKSLLVLICLNLLNTEQNQKYDEANASIVNRQLLGNNIEKTQSLLQNSHISAQLKLMNCETNKGPINLQALLIQKQEKLRALEEEALASRFNSPINNSTTSPVSPNITSSSNCTLNQIKSIVNESKLLLDNATANGWVSFGTKEDNCHIIGELSHASQKKYRLYVRPYYPGEPSYTFIVDKIEELVPKLMDIQIKDPTLKLSNDGKSAPPRPKPCIDCFPVQTK